MPDTFSRDERSRIMRSVRTKHTGPEVQVRSIVHKAGFRYSLHRKDLPGNPDIVFPKYRLAVFIHGCFWHGHDCARGRPPSSNRAFWNKKIKGNKRRDRESVARLSERGWAVHVIWQCKLKQDTEELLSVLRRRREALERRN